VDESRRVKLSAEQLIVLEDKDIDKAADYSSSVLSDAIKDNRTAVVESSSFSSYVVNFTYDRMNYHMYNRASMTAGEIRDLMSKTGTISVVNSNSTKLTVSGSGDGATITPNEAITAGDGVVLTLKIGDILYAINITASVNESDITINDVTTWQGLQDAINGYTEGSVIRLTSDVTCDNNKRLDVNKDSNKNVVIDLNGHTINRNLENNKKEDGHVMQVHKGSLTITDSTGTKGQIKKGYADNGGAIFINEDATVTINGGTITDNQADVDGGAIYCKGVLIMNGGFIISNSAHDTGGAIYVEDNSKSKIELHNVDISSNKADNQGGAFNLHIKNDSIIDNCIFSYNESISDYGGAIYMDADSKKLTINNTKFEENKSDDDGGAIYLEDGTIEMTKGSFNNNTSQNDSGAVKVTDKTTFKATDTTFNQNRSVTEEGGAIKNASNTELVNCTFDANMSQKEGGAIWSDDNLVITGCTFTNNTSAYKGGAIFSDDELRITGTSDNPTKMTGNSCQKGNGGALFVGGSSDNAEIGGLIQIMDNTANNGNNVYLREGRKFESISKIETGSEIHLTAEDELGVVVKNFGQYNSIDGSDFLTGPHNFFKSDNGLGVRRKGNDVELHSGWAKLQDDINAADDGAEIDVYGDFSASSDEESITIPAGKHITLDLNGHTLNRNLTDDDEHGHVIDVNKGHLTIIDSSARKSGTLTGGYDKERGGGIAIGGQGSCTIKSCNIVGNKSKEVGGGIASYGTLTIDASDADDKVVISDNSADDNGGGIYIYESGKISLNNVTIHNNSCGDEYGGGGICLSNIGDSEVTFDKITVTGNSSGKYAGGILMNASNKTLNINNSNISNNTSSEGIGGMYIEAGTVNMTGTTVNNNTTGKDAGGVKVNPGCTFTANNCTFSANKANGGEGGGIKNHGSTTLTNCTLNANTSDGNGGGIYNNKSGDSTASASLTNCTVTNNTSKKNGGGIYNNDSLTVSGSTSANSITKNSASAGGGIYVDSSSTNSIINDQLTTTGNSSNSGGDIYVNNSGSSTLNLDNSTTIGNDPIYVDCSDKNKAITSGKELNDPPVPFQAPVGYSIDIDGDKHLVIIEGQWSDLQTLIDSTSSGNTITLDKSYCAKSGDKYLEIKDNKDITIDLNGHTLDRKCSSASDEGHVFVIRGGSKLTITDSSNNNAGRITGGFSDKGGAFYVENGATLSITGGTISGNRADEEGGAIYLNGDLEMTGGIIKDNYSDDIGGAIYCDENGSFDISNAEFTNNSSKNSGGVINAEPDAVQHNTSAIHSCTFTNNASGDNGGVIRLASKDFTLTIDGDTTIDKNYSSDDGGAIYIHNGTIVMNGGSISNNGTDNDSGAVKVTGNTEFRATNVDINNNTAAREEAGAMKIFGDAYLTNCTLNNNDCAKEGGAISIVDGTTHITNCTFYGNNCTRKGGAIYSDSDLYIDGIEATGNSAKEGGGIYADDNIYIQGKIIIKNNTGRDKGDNYYCDERLQLSGALDNASDICVQLDDGTGQVTEEYSIYHGETDPSQFFTSDEGFDAYIEEGEVYFGSSWSSLEDQFDDAASGTVIDIGQHYSADDDDGPLTVDDKNIIVDLHGYTLNRNRTGSGAKGHVFRLINGATLTIRDSSGNNSGIITGGYANNGGAVNMDDNSTLNIEGGTIKGNSAGDDGGAIYAHSGTINISGGVIRGNNADNGAGIFLEGKNRAKLVMTGGIITENTASDEAGGIYAEEGNSKTSIIEVSGSPKVFSNSGRLNEDIYLDKNVIINVTGELSDGANLVVDKDGGVGAITNGYGANNGEVAPSKYFSSAMGYNVTLADNEAVLGFNTRGEDEYAKPFVEPKNQIETDLNQLGNTNWMAGISGERYLNEINMTVTHDSSMNNIETKWFDFTFWMPIGPFVHKLAKTQEEYIDEQMQHGIRKFDLRLNPVYKKYYGIGYFWEDDGENLFMCHGKTKFGTIQALDYNDDYLKFNTILDWSAEFLREHPTETIILELAAELDTDYQNEKWTTETFARAGRILNDFSRLKNPSTGESYLYKEPEAESYLDPYTHMPQLKDCRGKVVIMSNSNYLDKTGGFALGSVGVKSWSGQDHTISPEQKIVETTEHYKELETSFGKTPDTREGRLPLRTDVGKMDNFVWSFGLNVTHEQNSTSYVWRRIKAGADCAPYEYARTVNGALFGENKLFDSTSNGENDKTGTYLGWVSIDGAKAEYAEEVWKTNFNYNNKFQALDNAYVTLTIEPDDEMKSAGYPTQTYKLLKGTTISIPDNIYKNLNGKYLRCWEEVAGQQQVPFFFYYPDDSLTIERNMTLKPVFYKDGQVPVSIEWVDGNNADNLRDDKISFKVKPSDNTKPEYNISVTKEQGYRTSVQLNENDEIVPNWTKGIRPVPGYPQGIDGADQYRYELTKDKMLGYVFRFIHTPINSGQTITGNINWIEPSGDTSKRPNSVSVSLYRKDNDVQVGYDTVLRDEVSYSFENVPRFSDGKEIEYYIKVDPIDNYTTIINGYNITNVLKSEAGSVEGYVVWDDNDNENNKRPASVELKLYDNGALKGTQTVNTDDSYMNPFKFSNITHSGSSKYTVVQTTQPDGYITTVTTAEDGSIIVANKYLGNKQAYTLDTYSTDKECREAVVAPDVSPRNLTKTYVENTTVTVDAQRMRGYDFLGWYNVEQMDGDRVTKYSSEPVTPDYDYAFELKDNTKLVAVYDHQKTEINGTIEWVDDDDVNDKRPDYVTINILQNGTRISSNNVKGWKSWTFDNLAYQDYNKNPYKYTVTQDAIPEYKTEIITQDDGSILIRNTYQKKKYSFNVYSSNKECKAAIINPKVSPVKDIYEERDEITVNAVNKYGYEFLGWYEVDEVKNGKVTKYGKLVSTDIEYTFEIQQNTGLVAVYQPKFTNDMWPTGVSGLKADNTAKVLLNNPDKNLPEGYTLMYAMGASSTSVPTDDNFTLTMPKGYSVGTYNIWVKIVGDDNHDCSIQPRCITVEVARDEENPEESGNYEDVPTTPGEVKDITGTEDAPNEENPYDVKIEDIPNIPITEEQKKLGVNIWMEVLPLDPSSLSDEQKQKIASAAGDYTVCEYLDIALFVKIGPYNAMEIHQLKTASGFSFLCPIKYRQNDRQYSVVRLHEGTAKALPASYDSDSGLINVMSDQFSVYALAYKDNNYENAGSGSNTQVSQSTTTYKVKAAKTKDEFNIGYVFMSII
ncbi:MAG: Cna B-type domain-containing protein, partial [Lachnospiraceae bacterium]|nr:Cna B-type domain-containing protein [Lachnospiraceae bacterium]